MISRIFVVPRGSLPTLAVLHGRSIIWTYFEPSHGRPVVVYKPSVFHFRKTARADSPSQFVRRRVGS
jgi:hypothetical protein